MSKDDYRFGKVLPIESLPAVVTEVLEFPFHGQGTSWAQWVGEQLTHIRKKAEVTGPLDSVFRNKKEVKAESRKSGARPA